MRLSHLAAAVVATAALALMLASMPAHAAGKDLITTIPVITDPPPLVRTRVPVKIADATTVYGIEKYLTRARMGALIRGSLGIGGVAALVALEMAEQYATDHGQTINVFNNTFVRDQYNFSWINSAGCPSPITASSPDASIMQCGDGVSKCAVYDCYWFESKGPCIASDNYGCRTQRYNMRWKLKSNGSLTSAFTVDYVRTSNTYVTHEQTAIPDEELGDFATNYENLERLKDLFRTPSGYPRDDFLAAPHGPLPMTQTQIDQLNEMLRNGLNPAYDALANELAKYGREHGVTGGPDPTTVPDAVKGEGEVEGENRIIVNVNVPTDTAGNAFTEPALEELSTWEQMTQDFYASVQAAPIVAAWSGITASVPTGSCPAANIVAFGNTYSLSEPACDLWETYVVPVISLCFLFVWPFMGLRIVMSS